MNLKTVLKMKNKLKKFGLIALSIIMLLALSVSFISPVAEKLSDLVKYPLETVQNIARTVLFVSVAAFLIWAGVLSLGAPLVAGALIITGVALMWYALKPYFRNKDGDNE
jgi:phosphatidylglycerophosphate synthase